MYSSFDYLQDYLIRIGIKETTQTNLIGVLLVQDILDEMAKNCMKIKKVTFLGQGSERHWGTSHFFRGVVWGILEFSQSPFH